MPQQQSSHIDHQERNYQIKKLLQAIANYNPTVQQQQSMQTAKRQMQRNIQKKFINSQTNTVYRFPYITNDYENDYQQQYEHDFIDSQKQYVLSDQNNNSNKPKISLSRQKSRPPLRQKSQNKLTTQKQQRFSLKSKQYDQSFISNIQKVLESNLKCQTPKVIKKQIILTNKKHPIEKENTKSGHKQQYNNFVFCEPTQANNIRAKLKIKKPNSTLNQTKKQIHLKTQNNVTFKARHHEHSISKIYLESQDIHQIPRPINQEPSLEESLFNNSRLNQNIDENPNFDEPSRGMFNVHQLKEKLRDTSKQSKKIGIKRHKRTATQGDTSMIKIKLFSNSFRKENFHEVEDNQKHNVSTHLFMKKTQNIACYPAVQRTVRSTLSQHSFKKGISVCAKTKQSADKSHQKSVSKCVQRSVSKQCKHEKKPDQKQSKGFQKTQIKNFTIMLKPSESKKKQFMQSKSVRKELSSQKVIHLKSNKKENYETARISKISSIMSNLKEQYKNKNCSKLRTGIKTTICL